MKIDKFVAAATLRQSILDWMHQRTGTTCEQLRAHFGLKDDHAYRTLCKMETHGEVHRQGSGRGSLWVAVLRDTRSANEMRDAAYNRAGETRARNLIRPPTSTGNEYVNGRLLHIVGWDTPTTMPGQGGQGGCHTPRLRSCMA